MVVNNITTNNRSEVNLDARALDTLEELAKLVARRVVLKDTLSYFKYLKIKEKDPDKYKGFLDVLSTLINKYKNMPEALDAILYHLLIYKYDYLIKHAGTFLREDISKFIRDIYQIAKEEFTTDERIADAIGNAVVYILTCDGNYGCGCPNGLESAIRKIEEIPGAKRLLLYWNGMTIILNLMRYEAKGVLEENKFKEYLTRITKLLKNLENISGVLDRISFEVMPNEDCTPPSNLKQRLDDILNRLESMYSSTKNQNYTYTITMPVFNYRIV